VNFVVKTSVAAVVGLISVGGASVSINGEGTLAHSVTSCSMNDHIYTVAHDDTWSALAARFNVTQKALVKQNKHMDGNVLETNQTVCVPKKTQAVVSMKATHAIDVVARTSVQPMQTLYFRARAVPAPAKKPATIGAQVVNASPLPITSSIEPSQNAPTLLAQGAPGSVMAPIGAGGRTNPYPYPACTWWADQRYYQIHGVFVPWTNNAMAWQWSTRASEFGWRVSGTPRVGSILVLQPGVQGAGPYGHVAVVEEVLDNYHVIASSMNWGANPYAVTRGDFVLSSGVTFISQ
jgi:surface antigen